MCGRINTAFAYYLLLVEMPRVDTDLLTSCHKPIECCVLRWILKQYLISPRHNISSLDTSYHAYRTLFAYLGQEII